MRTACDGHVDDTANVISRHFTAQAQRPEHLTELEVRRLSPYQRSLLVVDGTTRLMEAHALEAVRARCTAECESSAQHGFWCAWLDSEPDTPVVRRQVDLIGRCSGRLFGSADSVLVQHRLPAALARGIGEQTAGIGSALHAAHVEHHRELLWFGGADDGAVVRAYRVFIGRRPAMFITERFVLRPEPGESSADPAVGAPESGGVDRRS